MFSPTWLPTQLHVSETHLPEQLKVKSDVSPALDVHLRLQLMQLLFPFNVPTLGF